MKRLLEISLSVAVLLVLSPLLVAAAVWKSILSVRPGLVDPASLDWRNEARLLAAATDSAHEYVRNVLPNKLAMSLAYRKRRTLRTDFALFIDTVRSIVGTRSFLSDHV